jgi:hypothetical protein
MIKYGFLAATALAMMTGVAVAQTSSSSTTSTQSTTAPPAPLIGGSSASSTQQTTDSNGTSVSNTKTNQNGIGITPSGNLATTNKTTDTTTVR